MNFKEDARLLCNLSTLAAWYRNAFYSGAQTSSNRKRVFTKNKENRKWKKQDFLFYLYAMRH